MDLNKCKPGTVIVVTESGLIVNEEVKHMTEKLRNEKAKERAEAIAPLKVHVRANTGNEPPIRIKYKNGSTASYLRNEVPERGDRPLHDSVVSIMRFLHAHKDKVFVVEEYPDQKFADALFKAFRVISGYKDYPQHTPLAWMLEREPIANYYPDILDLERTLKAAAHPPSPELTKEDNPLKLIVRTNKGKEPSIWFKGEELWQASYIPSLPPKTEIERLENPLNDSVFKILRFLQEHKDKVFLVRGISNNAFPRDLFWAFRCIGDYYNSGNYKTPLNKLLNNLPLANYPNEVAKLEKALKHWEHMSIDSKTLSGARDKVSSHYEGKDGVNLKAHMAAFGTPEEVYGFRKWNANKYIIRAGLKVEPGLTPLQSKVKDLKKARDYLNDMIEDAEKELKDASVSK